MDWKRSQTSRSCDPYSAAHSRSFWKNSSGSMAELPRRASSDSRIEEKIPLPGILPRAGGLSLSRKSATVCWRQSYFDKSSTVRECMDGNGARKKGSEVA